VLVGYNQGDEMSPADKKQEQRALSRVTHQTIRKVTEDLERLRLNTMIAALMEFTNYLTRVKETGSVTPSAWEEAMRTLMLLLAPTAPHLAEELWQRTKHDYSIHNRSWPDWNDEIAKDEETTLVIQVNGKVRDRITVPVSITESEALWLATGSHKVEGYLKGKDIIKKVYVPGKLVNLVVR